MMVLLTEDGGESGLNFEQFLSLVCMSVDLLRIQRGYFELQKRGDEDERQERKDRQTYFDKMLEKDRGC